MVLPHWSSLSVYLRHYWAKAEPVKLLLFLPTDMAEERGLYPGLGKALTSRSLDGWQSISDTCKLHKPSKTNSIRKATLRKISLLRAGEVISWSSFLSCEMQLLCHSPAGSALPLSWSDCLNKEFAGSSVTSLLLAVAGCWGGGGGGVISISTEMLNGQYQAGWLHKAPVLLREVCYKDTVA